MLKDSGHFPIGSAVQKEKTTMRHTYRITWTALGEKRSMTMQGEIQHIINYLIEAEDQLCDFEILKI